MQSSARPAGIVHFPSEVDVNPYTRLLYRGLARFGFELVPDGRLTLSWLWRSRRTVSFLHLHWCPNDLYECRGVPPRARLVCSWVLLPVFLTRLAAARLLGYTLAWTIHEIYPHASVSRRLDRLAARCLVRVADVLLAHDRATAERAVRELGPPARRTQVVPHSSYAGFYPPGRPRAAVRADHGIPGDAFAFLCFGTLKPYKEIALLLEAFRSLENGRVALVVAGRARDEHVAEQVRAAAAADARIKPLLRHVADAGVGELYEACDAAVIPRSDGWTSGSLILALSQGLPLVAARTPAYEELIGDAGWFFRPGDAASLHAALDAAAKDSKAGTRRAKARRRAERLPWDECTAVTGRLLTEASGRRGRKPLLLPRHASLERR